MLESLCGGSQEKKIQTDHTKSMAKKKERKVESPAYGTLLSCIYRKNTIIWSTKENFGCKWNQAKKEKPDVKQFSDVNNDKIMSKPL